MLINVWDYAKFGTPGDDPIQAALDAALPGDRIYIPGVVPYTAPSAGWLIDKSLEVYGDLDGSLSGTIKGTILNQPNSASPHFKVLPPAGNVHLHDLRLHGAGGTGAGVGILCQSTTSAHLEEIRLRRLFVQGFPSYGIRFDGVHALNGRIIGASVFDCLVRDCSGAGISILNADSVMLAGTSLRDNQGSGLTGTASGIALYQCDLESNSRAAGLGALDANLKLDNCEMARVDACRFTGFQLGPVKKAVVLIGCGGAMVDACDFEVEPGTGTEGIVVTGSGAGPAAILSNRFKEVNVLIRIDPGARDCVVFPQYADNAAGIGTIVLPYPNEGMYGAPHIVRPGGVEMSGLLVPSSAADPTTGLRQGMLSYNTTLQSLRAYVNGTWNPVALDP